MARSFLAPDQGFETRHAGDSQSCLEQLANETFDVVMLDHNLEEPGVTGIDLIPRIHEVIPDLPVIIMTGENNDELVQEALNAGASWYFDKPLNPKFVPRMLKKDTKIWRSYQREKSRSEALADTRQADHKLEHMIGKSNAIVGQVLNPVDKVAQTDSTVLITGESGTGKELVARAIHFKSLRFKRPLVTVNCGAIPEELLESELFGHVKGAFTNAVARRKGRFEAAEGGTIFLDEIGDMSATLQVKLLRVLQERQFEPVGSSETQDADVRVIAATHQDLEKLIEEKRFREDLYYRLNVFPIRVPPLRERVGEPVPDVALLIYHFLALTNAKSATTDISFTDQALERLIAYEWPGNIRELENCIERMGVLHEGEIDVADLPEEIRGASPAMGVAPRVPPEGLRFNEVVEQVETDLILQALEYTNWNKNQAASKLGLNRTTLLEKIKKKGLRPPQE